MYEEGVFLYADLIYTPPSLKNDQTERERERDQSAKGNARNPFALFLILQNTRQRSLNRARRFPFQRKYYFLARTGIQNFSRSEKYEMFPSKILIDVYLYIYIYKVVPYVAPMSSKVEIETLDCALDSWRNNETTGGTMISRTNRIAGPIKV